jgi:DNA-binding HxlR family transcriptional regulator
MRKQRHTAYTNCPVEAALDIIGGKWKSVILFRLLEQTRRFNELRRLLPAITQRTLTSQLRELERDGLVLRTIYQQVPPRVDYELTKLGMSLLPVLQALKTWSEEHMPERMREAHKAEAATSDETADDR